MGCEKCKDTNMLIGNEFIGDASGTNYFARLRMDLGEYNSFDIQYGARNVNIGKIIDEDNWSSSIAISTCPFCGTRLPITMTVDGFIDTFDKYNSSEMKTSDNIYMYAVFKHLKENSEYSIEDETILKFLTLYYNTPVIAITKKDEYVTIIFADPGYANLNL